MRRRTWLVLGSAAVVLAGGAVVPWHADPTLRTAAALCACMLLLWVCEIAPPGVIALSIPVLATTLGLVSWSDALASWGDPILFLFLGTFLLARALEKHGVFERLLTPRRVERLAGAPLGRLLLVILGASGLISTVQNNTATTVILSPPTLALARASKAPAIILLALAFGATFGGMATPIGTSPNLIGYSRVLKLDPSFGFFDWMRVGVPVWIGTSLIGAGALLLAHRVFGSKGPTPGGARAAAPPASTAAPGSDESTSRAGARAAILAAAATVVAWLTIALLKSNLAADHPLQRYIAASLPESLIPIAAAWLLFMVPLDRVGRTTIDRSDFAMIDWDTLFLMAGGLCLGVVLEQSGAAKALAVAVAHLKFPPLVLALALGGTTVALSTLISNTATASIFVPIAVELAPAVGLTPVQAVWMTAMAASLGLSLPISTPPNAIVYGTGLIKLRQMALAGVVVDILAAAWVILCLRMLA